MRSIHVSSSIRERFRLGLSGENLLDGQRTEGNGERGQVQPRSVRASLQWRF
jgi:hypothetical protein